jgi:anti-anti-sigma factor
LEVRTDRHPEGCLIELSGELDLSNVGTLEAELQQIDGDGAVLLDLTHLEFMDSAAACLIARTSGDARSWAGRLRVRNASGQVERMIRLCGLEAYVAAP